MDPALKYPSLIMHFGPVERGGNASTDICMAKLMLTGRNRAEFSTIDEGMLVYAMQLHS